MSKMYMQQASGSVGGPGSTCSSSGINTSSNLHSGISGNNSHAMTSQQPTSGSQNQIHTQQQSTIRHKVCANYFFFPFDHIRAHVCAKVQTKHAYCALKQ